MSKKLEITSKHLVNIKPVTDNQKVVFESWKIKSITILVWCCWNW